MPKISVIILTYNSRGCIKPCLDSLFGQRHEDVEVIVVDNGSNDSTLDLIRGNYPGLRIIANKGNLGASRGRNQGIEAASGEWILTLDCDVILEDGFIKEAMELASSPRGRLGIIQPKILSKSKKKIYSCGIGVYWLKRFYDIGRNSSDGKMFGLSFPVFGACCAAALYRRKMLDDLKDRYGYFDERFFFLFEDADLSWRAQKKGWICMFYPKTKCFHGGNSSSTDGLTRQLFSFRNRHLAILKNQNPVFVLLMLPAYFIYDIPRFLVLLAKFRFNFKKFYNLYHVQG
ncbi:MAG: glycosyltransferase family 2 protein [Candidatus Omnitrophica bacterium]|nr:glycosyltransferase family 2 protein [Candidatus Omnitrophota bacterium]MDD5660754.1 glycosyltransferase family 2 protein [Candidatus Omnitrophota bacterium]